MPELRDRLAAALAPRYLVDRELATGGMGMVFLGRDPTLDREVAIKVLPPERASAVTVERFLRETRLLAQLTHPNIVPIFDAQHTGELLWFVMPRIRGETLAQRIAGGPLPPAEVVRIGRGLLRALHHAHTHGVIHRDIKPSNIFVDGDHVLLADFGVALLDGSGSETLTGTDQVVGTLRYMAPEQRSRGEVTESSDLYALGVTLFEAATGRRWDQVDPTASTTWRPLPRSLGRALRRALAPEPARRWRDADAFRRALVARRPQGRHPLLFVTSAAVVVGLGILGARVTRTPVAAPGQRAALVILPFDRTPAGVDLARYASLPIEFSQVGVLPSVNVNRMTFDSARRVADRIVTGEVHIHGGGRDTLAVTVRGADGTALQLLRIPGDSGDPGAWGLAIADSLVRRLFPTEVMDFRQLAATRHDRDALDAYAEGQRLFQSGQWREAEERFARAERIDTTMVQATWHKLIARQWQALPFKQELARLAARVGPGRGALSGLLAAQLEPDLDRRMARYDSLAAAYPNDPMVREMHANELFSRGPLIGLPLARGIEAFRLAAEEIPQLNQANTYMQTVWGAVRIGNEPLARAQLRRRHAPAGDQWGEMLWLAVNGRFRRWLAVPAREFMLRTADSSKVATLSRAVRIGLDVDDPLDQLAIARYLEHRPSTDRQRSNALAAQATALLLLGRPLDALRSLDRGASFVPGDRGYQMQRWEWRVLLPLLPGATIALPDSTRENARRELARVPDTASHWPRAVWTLAIDAMARHDIQQRDSLLTLLRRRASTPWIADMAAVASAIAVGQAGHPDSALALSRRIHRDLPDSEVGLRGPLLRALTYLHRGAWQVAAGRPARAEQEWIWHENNDIPARPEGEPDQGELDAALSAIARLRRAEVLQLPLLDRQRDACELLARVESLWRDAEPSLHPLQARVRDGRQACRQ